MKQKEIFELIEKFEQTSLTKMEVKDGEFSLTLEYMPPAPVPGQGPVVAATPAPVPQNAIEEQCAAPQVDQSASNAVTVKAPIVGVFYAAPAPDADAFVHPGDKVEKGQVLCLVEAMKMMNELKSPVDGIIKSIKGINGELVEFNQVLFEVEPC